MTLKKLFTTKKANFSETWVEWSSLWLLILAMLLSLVSRNALVTYLIILAAGMIVGRSYYLQRYQPKMVKGIMAIAFLIGFLIGSFMRQMGNPRLIIVIYIIGIYVGYVLHRKGHLW